MTAARYGATEGDWAHLDLVLGLGADLLPVVSNPNATISPASKVRGLGKTPSRYNAQGNVAGIAEWTSHVATPAEITAWAAEPDYGICVQTRTIRAIDCDITDEAQAKEIHELLEELVLHALPTRRRGGASKFLCPIALPDGAYTKRIIRTAHGIIEFLATGQQFVAVGTHPSGARYEWDGGLPSATPQLTAEQFEALWSALEARFAIAPSSTSKASTKAQVLAQAAANDPAAVALEERGLVLSSERDGKLHIICPFESEHSPGERTESATTYFPANTGGYLQGHFHCLHAHCDGRTDREFLNALGIVEDFADDFEAIVATEPGHTSARFTLQRAREFMGGPPLRWIVKGVLPQVELVSVYGPPGSGKSFWVLDLMSHIARGIPWQGRRVHQGSVCYVAAEGAAGFRNRLTALMETQGIEDMDLHIIDAAPNLMKGTDVVDLGNAVNAAGRFRVIVVDTLAKTMVGADENSAQDMGVVIANCNALARATGATVILIHHTGKDESRGMRGSSATLGALDAGIAISRMDDNRTATIMKMKDGEDGAQFGFVLNIVPIGMDEDGDVISSCTVKHVAVATPKPKEKKATAFMVAIWDQMLEMASLGDGGVDEAALLERMKTVMPITGVKDQRVRDGRRALDTWCAMEKLKRLAGGKVVFVNQEEA